MIKHKKIRVAVILVVLFIGIYFLGNKIIYHIEIKKIEEKLSETLVPTFEKMKITVMDETVDDEIPSKEYNLKFSTLEFNPWHVKEKGNILEGLGDVEYIAIDENGQEMYRDNIRMPFERKSSKDDFNIKWDWENPNVYIHDFSFKLMNKAAENQFYKYENSIAQTKIKDNPSDKEDEEKKKKSYGTLSLSGTIYKDGGDVSFHGNSNVLKGDIFKLRMELTGTKAVMNVVCEHDLNEFSGVDKPKGMIIYIKKKAPIGNPLWNVSLEDIESIDVSYSENGPKDYYQEFEVEDKVKIEQIYEVINNISVDTITTQEMNELNYDEKKFVRVSLYLKDKRLVGFQINKNGIFFDDFIGLKSKEEGEQVLKLIEKIVEKE
ncbi:hypothetical protein [Oceanirhabdus seepicola]|uniref:Uncharacterized protein n=1 Tax=Oceanirhabdus seepicola TaxID=2828781 RepID=A0A9J6P003_9CLOT|nr:hypothetical protein [Oceanirhabdus seepicola]MCM1989197.1 hypothetical protein [Oceanirhabdus seepicola]